MFKTESRVNTNGFLQVYQSLVWWKEESKVVCYKSITLAENYQLSVQWQLKWEQKKIFLEIHSSHDEHGFLQVYQSFVWWKEESKVVCCKSITLAENNQLSVQWQLKWEQKKIFLEIHSSHDEHEW